MGMSISYELSGRTRQKGRTRNALVAAARELLSQGATPTVEQTAEAADVSRATAYRYFPNQRALLVAAHPEIEEESSMLGQDGPADARERYELVVERLTRLVLETEAQQRATLRLSLELEPEERKGLVLRQGRAIRWLEEALSPLQGSLTEAALRRLVLATRSACGIEALVWLTDVGGLSREEAQDVMRWTAGALFDATTAEAA
jgi:AcrR family transcriptional regulator